MPRPRGVFPVIASLLGIVSACGAPSRHDFRYVAGDVERRTGYAPRDAATTEPEIPDGVSLADGLSQDEAAALGLWNNTAFRETLAQLGLSRSALVQAGLLSNPVFSVLFPLGAKQLEFALKLPVEAMWLRPKRVAAARLDAEQVAQQLVQSGLDVVRDARVRWAELRRVEVLLTVAEESAGIASKIATLVEARHAAGDVSTLEAAAARTDAAVAEEDALRLRHEARIAEERLRSLLGLSAVEGPLRLQEAETAAPLLPSSLVDLAFAARPDLRAAELTVEAARERAGLSRFEALSLAGIADAKHEGSRGLLVGPGLEVGIPIFDWNQGGMARADAEVVRAVRHEAAVRDGVALEVQQAAANYERAREVAELLDTRVVPELEQSTRRAESAFAAGDTSRLEPLAARTQLLRARMRQADAAADLSVTKAELERSIGSRLEAPAAPERAASR
jgi:cobalt-zinc-cadmium efflux system outer membrane protein